MKARDARDWIDTVLDEVFAGIAASETLTDILVFKGARILARYLPSTLRQSLDIDANCSQEFLANFPDRQTQARLLQEHFGAAVHRQFESASPVQYQLTEVKVLPKPRNEHPRGWNAFEVQLRVIDASRPTLRGVPALQIDIAYPEELSADSTTLMKVASREVRAYALHRIAGEKLRAFLSSLPDYQAKIGRVGGILRAKDLYDLAQILRFRPLTDHEFWGAAAREFRAACTSRFVDCMGSASFGVHEASARAIYTYEPTIPGDVSFEQAWQSLEAIVSTFESFNIFPIEHVMPAL